MNLANILPNPAEINKTFHALLHQGSDHFCIHKDASDFSQDIKAHTLWLDNILNYESTINGTRLRYNGVDFRSLKLDGLDMRGASLRYCDFRGMDLGECDLRGADLTGSDFTGARVDSTKFEDAVIDGALFDQ